MWADQAYRGRLPYGEPVRPWMLVHNPVGEQESQALLCTNLQADVHPGNVGLEFSTAHRWRLVVRCRRKIPRRMAEPHPPGPRGPVSSVGVYPLAAGAPQARHISGASTDSDKMAPHHAIQLPHIYFPFLPAALGIFALLAHAVPICGRPGSPSHQSHSAATGG